MFSLAPGVAPQGDAPGAGKKFSGFLLSRPQKQYFAKRIIEL